MTQQKITWNEDRTWVRDENGNRCSVVYFGSEDNAEAALKSLQGCNGCVNCKDCSDCWDCVQCSDCTDCLDCVRCSGCSDGWICTDVKGEQK